MDLRSLRRPEAYDEGARRSAAVIDTPRLAIVGEIDHLPIDRVGANLSSSSSSRR